jgi:serine/threonine protein phosphatase PrpC
MKCAGFSHRGLVRSNNEDRFHCDPGRGIFFVVDGVGGQAAGETAAETAVAQLRRRLERRTGDVRTRLREAIALSNNEIHRLAQARPDWRGMACVLTAAVVENGRLVAGHVGDTRLYKIGPGRIDKLTHDHSPIGEREDRGEIGELEAMRHPRRNEVYRDVGSTSHTPADTDFIEIVESPFEADSALLLCSDGLTDQVTAARILALAEAHAGDPAAMARALVDAANAEGGKDNVTAVVVVGEDFDASVRRRRPVARRPSGAADAEPATKRARSRAWIWFLAGALSGIGAYAILDARLLDGLLGSLEPPAAPALPRRLDVRGDGSAPFATISAALQAARPGDTVVVGPGEYREQVRLRDGVTLASDAPGGATLRPVAPGPAVITAEDLRGGRVSGLRIAGDAAAPAQIGLHVANAAIVVEDLEIAGTLAAAIEIRGPAPVTLRANHLHDNAGTGVLVRADAHVWLAHNLIVRNGRPPADPRPGVDIEPGAMLTFVGNVITGNGAEGIRGAPEPERERIDAANVFAADGEVNDRGPFGLLTSAPARPGRPRR